MAKHSDLNPEILCWSFVSQLARSYLWMCNYSVLSEHYQPSSFPSHSKLVPPLLKLWLVISDHQDLSDFPLKISQIQIIFTTFVIPSLFQALIFSCLKNFKSSFAPPAYIPTPKSTLFCGRVL